MCKSKVGAERSSKVREKDGGEKGEQNVLMLK